MVKIIIDFLYLLEHLGADLKLPFVSTFTFEVQFLFKHEGHFYFGYSFFLLHDLIHFFLYFFFLIFYSVEFLSKRKYFFLEGRVVSLFTKIKDYVHDDCSGELFVLFDFFFNRFLECVELLLLVVKNIVSYSFIGLFAAIRLNLF